MPFREELLTIHELTSFVIARAFSLLISGNGCCFRIAALIFQLPLQTNIYFNINKLYEMDNVDYRKVNHSKKRNHL